MIRVRFSSLIDALAHYLGCGGDVPLVRRVLEIEQRLAALEAKSEKKVIALAMLKKITFRKRMLTQKQRKKLRDGFISAFTDTSSLEQLLYFELDKNLNQITSDSNLQIVVFKLIQTAEAQEWLLDLVSAAREKNPGNSQLKAIADELLINNSSSDETEASKQQQQAQRQAEFDIVYNPPSIEENKTIPISPPALPMPVPAASDDLSSEKGVDYTRLRDLLLEGRWFEADEETLAVMLKATGRVQAGWLDDESIKNFPCIDLAIIDQLWIKYSKEQFGFSVQKRIWESVEKDYLKLGECVGWRNKWQVNKEWNLRREEVTFDTTAPCGHLPVVAAVWGVRLWIRWETKILITSSFFHRIATCNL